MLPWKEAIEYDPLNREKPWMVIGTKCDMLHRDPLLLDLGDDETDSRGFTRDSRWKTSFGDARFHEVFSRLVLFGKVSWTQRNCDGLKNVWSIHDISCISSFWATTSTLTPLQRVGFSYLTWGDLLNIDLQTENPKHLKQAVPLAASPKADRCGFGSKECWIFMGI